MDVKEDGKIPLFNGRITMKATRVSWERNINIGKEFLLNFQKQEVIDQELRPAKDQEKKPEPILKPQQIPSHNNNSNKLQLLNKTKELLLDLK